VGGNEWWSVLTVGGIHQRAALWLLISKSYFSLANELYAVLAVYWLCHQTFTSQAEQLVYVPKIASEILREIFCKQ
jgi:hypothetical protein